MAAFEVFQYPVPASIPKDQALNRLAENTPLKDPVPLTGLVKGKRASDLEERFARALDAAGLEHRFQFKVMLAGSLPGQEKVIDFLVIRGWRFPVEIDGVIAHRTAAQQGEDLLREIMLNQALRRWGYFPIQRVTWQRLASQEMADRAVREMFGGR